MKKKTILKAAPTHLSVFLEAKRIRGRRLLPLTARSVEGFIQLCWKICENGQLHNNSSCPSQL